MAKVSVSRFKSVDHARTYYLNEVDKLLPEVPEVIASIHHVKWQEVVEGGGPMLEAEAESLGCTVETVIAMVRDARARWVAGRTAVEAARIKAKAAIRAAATPAEMNRALVQFRTVSSN